MRKNSSNPVGEQSGRRAARRRQSVLRKAVRGAAGRGTAGLALLAAAGQLFGIIPTAQAANTEYDVTNGQSDLTAPATYTTGGAAGTGAGGTTIPLSGPSVTSDVTFDSGVTYVPAAFTLNTSQTFGSLNDLSATPLTISNTSATGTGDTLTLGGTGWLGNSVPGTVSADLLYVATGSNLTINSGASGSPTALGLVLGQSGNFNVAGTASIGSIIAGGSTFVITKTGAGTLTLSGANTYTGTTAISVGTLQIGNATALGTTAGNTTIASGATLDLNGQTIAEPIGAIAGTGVGNNGALINNSGTAAAITGALAAGTFSVGGTGNITLPNLGNSSVITKVGNGTLTLSGSSDNVSGAVTVSAGTVIFGKASSTGAHSVGGATTIASGGTIQLGGTGDYQIYGGVSPTVGSGGVLDLNGKNQNYNGLGGSLLLSGAGISSGGALINSASGTTSTITFGTGSLALQTASSVGGVGNITITGGTGISGAFALTKVGAGTLNLSSSNTYSGGTTIAAGTLQIGGAGSLGSGSYAQTIANSGTLLQYSSSAAQTLSGAITGTGALTKDTSATSTLTLSSATNSYTGATSVSAGTLAIGSTGALANTAIGVTGTGIFAVTPGSGTVNLGNTATPAAGATLNLASGTTFSMVDGAIGTANLVQEGTFAGNALTVNTAKLNFEVSGGTADLLAVTKAVSVTGTNTINLTLLSAPAGTTTNNLITASGGLSTGGTFKLADGLTTGVVSFGANNYVATLNNSATLESVTINGAAAGAMTWTGQTGGNGAADSSWNTTGSTNFALGTTPVAFGNGNAVTFQDTNTVTGNPVASGTVTVQAGGVSPGSITFNNSAVNYTVGGGAISGTGTLTKSGNGTATLTSLSTNYTGATTINSGTLALNMNGTSLFASAVTVNPGTTLQFTPTANTGISNMGAVSLLGTMTYNPTGNFFNVIGTANNGAVTVSGGSSIINVSSTGVTSAGLYLDGGLKGSTALTVNAGTNGAMILRNTNNTYSGSMTVNGVASTVAGTGSGLVLGPVGTTMQNATLTLNGTLELGDSASSMGWAAGTVTGTTASIDALNGTGVVVGNMKTAASTRTLGVGNAGGTGSFSGVIANGTNNTLSFTKAGSGTQTLSNQNTYTGATAVSGGNLTLAFGTVASNILSSGSPLTMGGGTLQLTGTGTQTVNGLATTANTNSNILLGANETLTLGALTSAGAGSNLNFNTAAGGANATTTTVGTSLVMLTGQTAGSVINSGFTVADTGGFGLATVNNSNQVVRLTSAQSTLLPATGAVSTVDYLIDNNAGGSAAPGSSSLIVTAWEAAKSITVDTTNASGTLTLNSGVVLSNNTWNFGGSANTYQITNASGAAAGTGLNTVATASTMTVNNNNAGIVTLTSPILAFGVNPLVVNGTGTTVLAGANTYTGATTISGGGTLQFSSTGSLVAAYNAPITIGVGSTFRYSSATANTLGTNANITGAGGLTVDGGVDFTLQSTGNTYSGPTSISTNQTRLAINAAGALSPNTAITVVGSGTGGGQLFVNAAGTYPNNITISGVGFAEPGDSQANKDGAIRADAAVTLSGTITLAGNSRIAKYNSATTNTISGQITGGFGIDFYGMNGASSAAEVFAISNPANNYTGATTIYNSNYNSAVFTGSSTTLKLGASNVIPDGATAGNVVFAINGTDPNATNILDLAGFSETINGLTVNAGAAKITNSSTGASVLTIGANNTTSSFNGTVTDSGVGKTLGITKTGAGTLTLSNNATNYSGATTINSGTLALGMGGTSLFASPVTVNPGTTLQFTPTANTGMGSIGAVSLLGTMTYNPASSFFQVLGGTGSAGAVTVSGGASVINISPGSFVSANATGLYLDAGLKGSSALAVNATLNGAGLVLRTVSSTYSGTMTVSGNASTASGTGSGLGLGPVGTAMQNATLNINGTLELGDSATGIGNAFGAVTGTSVSIDALNGSGVVVGNMKTSASTRTLSVGNNGGTGTFSGVIANGTNNTLSLIKAGIGTQTLSNTNTNTYTGTTSVNAGTLLVNGTHGTVGGPLAGSYSIASPATLGGTGTINLAAGANVAIGGNLTPGPGNAVGHFTVTGGGVSTDNVLTLSPGANFNVFLSTAGTSSELLVNNGGLTITGANLVLTSDGNLTAGQTYTIIDPPGAITGQFATGTSGTSNGIPYTLAYNTTTNPETVTLTVVPEPGSLGLLGLAGLGLLARRRRTARASRT